MQHLDQSFSRLTKFIGIYIWKWQCFPSEKMKKENMRNASQHQSFRNIRSRCTWGLSWKNYQFSWVLVGFFAYVPFAFETLFPGYWIYLKVLFSLNIKLKNNVWFSASKTIKRLKCSNWCGHANFDFYIQGQSRPRWGCHLGSSTCWKWASL